MIENRNPLLNYYMEGDWGRVLKYLALHELGFLNFIFHEKVQYNIFSAWLIFEAVNLIFVTHVTLWLTLGLTGSSCGLLQNIETVFQNSFVSFSCGAGKYKLSPIACCNDS